MPEVDGGDPAEVYCPMCDRPFPTALDLEMHIRRHVADGDTIPSFELDD